MAELADAPDLGSGIHDVQVQLLSPAVKLKIICTKVVFEVTFYFIAARNLGHIFKLNQDKIFHKTKVT